MHSFQERRSQFWNFDQFLFFSSPSFLHLMTPTCKSISKTDRQTRPIWPQKPWCFGHSSTFALLMSVSLLNQSVYFKHQTRQDQRFLILLKCNLRCAALEVDFQNTFDLIPLTDWIFIWCLQRTQGWFNPTRWAFNPRKTRTSGFFGFLLFYRNIIWRVYRL